MSDIPPVYDAEDLDESAIEDMRDAADTYRNRYNLTDAFDRCRTDPVRLEFLQRLGRGDADGEEGIRNIVQWLLRPWHTARNFPEAAHAAAGEGLNEALGLLARVGPNATIEVVSRESIAAMKDAFEALDSRPHIGATAASKILAVIRPELFVMWDGPIAAAYGFAQNAAGYCRFLHLCNQTAGKLRRLWGDRERTIEQHLCPAGRQWHPPLAKSIDEWNWVRITQDVRAAERD